MSNNKLEKYSKQVVSFDRPNMVLGVEAQFFCPKEDKGMLPLELASIHRFVFSIIDTKGEKPRYCKANIPVFDLPAILIKTEKIYDFLLEKPQQQAAQESVPDCYKVKLTMGKYKGRTPAEVLLSDASAADSLKGQIEILQENLSKYPANRQVINAIQQALTMAAEKKLSEGAVVEQKREWMIYESAIKYFSTKNEKGDSQIYQITVKYDSGMRYPIVIQISNGYAPIQTNENGGTEIVMSKAYDMEKLVLCAGVDEWYNSIYHCKAEAEAFETVTFSNRFKIAERYAFKPDPSMR